MISREKGLRRVQYKTVLQSLFEPSTNQLAFRRARHRWECPNLQAEHGRNVVSTLAKGMPRCRRNPDHAEYWEFSWAWSETGLCGGKHSNWVRNRTSLAISACWNCAAWTSRSLCKLSSQCSGVIKASARHAVSRIKRRHPHDRKEELAVTSDGIRRAVRMASNSASECGSLELTRLHFRFRESA